ncbi:DUF4199 domain-containing protein [Winogradskyella sp. SYSU M77433]|uniref:DUF4199 domain-containing protein n=1 Tax=Winogradskyella sp. SYSU M77433 TaxID=3042722 RepID=UPI0024815063|nr:DUF4199 domain-containing protein [Winogradskyella sp. SYSU M77433]MDH7914162.1 DUF4199 domain-containing protein [Winogradskyella sp. SYSU M77433]
MEHQTPSIKPIAYTYGLYSALLSIAGLIIMYVANMDKNWILSSISVVVSILIFVYGIKAFKTANANILSLGQAIKVGLAIAVIAGVITAIYSYVHYEFIYPEFIEMQKETAYNQMIEQNPNMTDEQIEQAMSISNLFMNSTFFSLSSILGSLIFGLIVSLIAGLIMKNDR